MADKKNLCAQIDTALHMRVRQEQERSGRTLSEFVEQLITDYYKMKDLLRKVKQKFQVLGAAKKATQNQAAEHLKIKTAASQMV